MVEQATENRCVGGSIPPLGTIHMSCLYKITILLLVLSIQSCKLESDNFFPMKLDSKWTYSISIHSSYKDNKFVKRVMITNVKKNKSRNKTELAKLYSNGSYYTYEIDNNTNSVLRKSVVLAFNEGMVEPVQKIIYPDLNFKREEWEAEEQLFLVKGFQPPLRNFKPRAIANVSYKIIRKNFKFSFKKKKFNDCIEIEGQGKTNFIADTRSGPISVTIKNNEILCNNIGLVFQKRIEKTDASAFGNMELEKYLVNFQE